MDTNKVIDSTIGIEEIPEKEIKDFHNMLSKFIKSYETKDEMLDDIEWLKKEFIEELPNVGEEEAQKLSIDTINSIKEYDSNLKSLNEAYKRGISKEKWLEDKILEAATGTSVNDFGNYLNNIDVAITNGNAQMLRTVTTKAGDINQCYNLDGFIAEQYHVNKFNMKAALENSNFRAEVYIPKEGQTYGLNSFDAVIRDVRSGKIVHQYQFKFGSDAKATINLLKSGTYNNQRFVVPTEQVSEVQKAFLGKTVESFIGGTDQVTIKTEGITKEQVKELQLKTQQENIIPLNDWNNYNTKALIKNIGKNATMAGFQSVAITVGFDMAKKVMSGEKIEADETIQVALETGADTGIKVATAGALKVAIEKGIITIIPKGTPAGIIANIVCVSIENIKILLKVANGEITINEALDMMARTTISMIYGIGWGAAGAAIGVVVLGWIPIVGPVIGGIVGGMIGYMAGSKVGSAIYSGVKKVWEVAKGAVKAVWNGMKSVGRAVWSGAKNVVSTVKSWF